MDIFVKFINYLENSFQQGVLGLSILEMLIILASLVFAILVRGVFAKIIVNKIKKLVFKTGNKIDDHLFDTLAPPLKFLPIIFVFILMGLFVDNESQLGLLIEKINQTLVTIFIFWTLHQSLAPLSQAFQKLEELFSKALVIWLTRSLKYLVIFLGIVAVLETWGIKIGPVIAGL